MPRRGVYHSAATGPAYRPDKPGSEEVVRPDGGIAHRLTAGCPVGVVAMLVVVAPTQDARTGTDVVDNATPT
jgi:hypothetical protein